jgi:hypothetical protein
VSTEDTGDIDNRREAVPIGSSKFPQKCEDEADSSSLSTYGSE